jgi:hypothetical protein
MRAPGRRLPAVAALCVVVVAGCGSTVDIHNKKPAAVSPAPVATSPTAAGPAPTSNGQIPSTGVGWDSQNVYVGVMTENDAANVTKGLGMSNLNPGDQEADATAMADAINSAGGLFGRKIVIAFYDESTFSMLADPDSQAAGACSHFTEDRPVVAVINALTIIDTPTFKSCFASHHVPLFDGSEQPTDTTALDQLGGDVISVLSPSFTDVAPTLVARLKAEGYFTGWDARNGTSGTAPVKVGILTPNDPTGVAAAKLLSTALASAGYPPSDVFNFSASGTGSGTEASATLQFRARGITHVIGTGLNSYLFMQEAQSQGYHPRYGVTTFNAPGILLQGDVNRAQLVGSLGIGTNPMVDVDAAHDPGIISSGERACLTSLGSAGQKFGSLRFAEAVGLFYCDVFGLLRDSALAGHGLNSAAIIRGVTLAGPRFVPAETFSSGLAPGRFALDGSARDLGWSTGCDCYRYTSTTNIPIVAH